MIKIIKDKCIGCGTCVALAGNTFTMDEENKAEVINQTGDDQATIEMAINSCPTQAIEEEK